MTVSAKEQTSEGGYVMERTGRLHLVDLAGASLSCPGRPAAALRHRTPHISAMRLP
jgi:hypothetical protein